MSETVKDDAFLGLINDIGGDNFAAALEASGVGMLVIDLLSQQTIMSGSLMRQLGWTEGVRLPRGQARETLVHPDDRVDILKSLKKASEDGASYETVTRLVHRDGRFVHFTTHAEAILDEDGNPLKLIGILRNVDKLERGKESLARAERMAGLGHWGVDHVTDKLTWSDGTFIIHGLEPGSCQPELEWARGRIVDEDRQRVIDAIEMAIKNRESFGLRARIKTSDDEVRHIKILGNVEVGADGIPIAHYGTVQDITEEVEREEILLQSQKLDSIGNLAGGMAHDFNNLLAVILGNLEVLQDYIDSPEANALVESALAATLSGAELTRNMLSFARRSPMESKTLELNDIVRNLDVWARRTMPANIRTEVSLQSGLWTTDTDKSLAESALLNLVLNARDAMLDGGRLTIETANVHVDQEYIRERKEDLEPGRYVMLSVSDTGHGIPAGLLDRIAEPFFTTKEPGKGSGLGLPMVVGFLKQSGGALRIYSEPGVGTTFSALFKASNSNTMEPQDNAPSPAARELANIRILVAEDDPNVAATLLANLQSAGFHVTHASSGDSAKAVFVKDSSFDVLLTDMVMPGELQGAALAQELRRIRNDLPVIYMSGYANEANVHGNGLRPEDIRLMKPVRRKDLVESIQRVLRPVS